MACVKSVIFTFPALGESAHAAVLTQLIKTALAAAEQLVGIGLVSDIPDHLVLGEIEYPVHGYGQFDHAQIGGQMAAGPAGRLDQEPPDLLRQDLRLLIGQPADIFRSFYSIQNHIRILCMEPGGTLFSARPAPLLILRL